MYSDPRVAVVLIGDLKFQPSTQVKYGMFLKALAERFPLVDIIDATLYGLPRLLNAVQVFHPKLRTWKERFYHNTAAFQIRSQRVSTRLQKISGQADLVLQIGVLYDACWQPVLPGIIYTDYTAQLSARLPEAGRSPFTPAQLQVGIDLEKQAMQRAAHVCTRAEFVRQAILQDYDLPAEKVTSIGGGVNMLSLPVLQPREPSHPTALFIGADFYRKGGDILLESFNKVIQLLPAARLLMVARGPRPADLPAQVEWIAPTWDRGVIEALYRRADVFVLPSRLETWGDVLLEAMAFGLPCIGVRGGPMEEIIQENITGLLVLPSDPSKLSQALMSLLSDEKLRLDMGKAARQRVEEYFTWHKVVDRLAPVLLNERILKGEAS